MKLHATWIELNWIQVELKINGMQIGFLKNQNLLVTGVGKKGFENTHIQKTLSISFYLRMG